MKWIKFMVVTLWMAFFLCFGENVIAQSGELDSDEAGALEFALLFAELRQSFFENGSEQWADPALLELAADEQHYLHVLENLATRYSVEVSIYYWGCNVIFWEYEEFDFYCGLLNTDRSWWESREGYDTAGAYFEELNIRELKQAIEFTDEQLLVDTYTEMLGVAYAHLLRFASMLHDHPFDYEAQLLDQAEVDLALSEAIATSSEGFLINSGLNDAWFDPATDGQGFTISVFEDKGTVFLAWFTFDTELPGTGVTANLGDPGQRWLTAQGAYEGTQADLVVYSAGGGVFDASSPVPELESIGTMTLQFEDCYTGTVNYDIPGIGRSGSIAIERLATDNVCNCVVEGYTNR